MYLRMNLPLSAINCATASWARLHKMANNAQLMMMAIAVERNGIDDKKSITVSLEVILVAETNRIKGRMLANQEFKRIRACEFKDKKEVCNFDNKFSPYWLDGFPHKRKGCSYEQPSIFFIMEFISL